MRQNRIIWLMLFILSLVFIYFYGGVIPYTIFYIVCILPLFTLFLNIVAFASFKYLQDIDLKSVVKGQKITFNYSLYNESIFVYPYISVNFCNTDAIFANDLKTSNLSLKPLSSISEKTIIECRYRGRYEIGISHIDFIDFLGIFRFKYTVRHPHEITVYPTIVNIDKFNIMTSFASETQSRLSTNSQDFTTIAGVRKYQYGDSRRSVHWKLTAKMNELMVKKFEFTSEAETIIMLDLCNYGLPQAHAVAVEDKVIEAVVAVLNHCLSNYIKTHFIYYKDGIHHEQASNPNDFPRLYEFLSEVPFDQDMPISEVADVYLSENPGKVNLFIFTYNLDYKIYSTIYKAHLAGHKLGLVYISPEEVTGIKVSEEDNILTSLIESGIDIYRMNISSNTKEVLEKPA